MRKVRKKKPELADTLFIQFGLTKSEGPPPRRKEFTAEEAIDLRCCAKLNLGWEVEAASVCRTGLLVEDVSIVYDGVTPIAKRRRGLKFVRDKIPDTPSPVLKFKLNLPVDPELFSKVVWSTTLSLWPASFREAGKEPFYFEDWNGYTRALTWIEVPDLLEDVQDAGLYYRADISLDDFLGGILLSDTITKSKVVDEKG